MIHCRCSRVEGRVFLGWRFFGIYFKPCFPDENYPGIGGSHPWARSSSEQVGLGWGGNAQLSAGLGVSHELGAGCDQTGILGGKCLSGGHRHRMGPNQRTESWIKSWQSPSRSPIVNFQVGSSSSADFGSGSFFVFMIRWSLKLENQNRQYFFLKKYNVFINSF